MKQKIKKLEDKLEKVGSYRRIVKFVYACIYLMCVFMQDSSKISDMTKECEDSTNLIPKLQENIPKLQKVLLDEEKALDEIKEKAKGVLCLGSYAPNNDVLVTLAASLTTLQ